MILPITPVPSSCPSTSVPPQDHNASASLAARNLPPPGGATRTHRAHALSTRTTHHALSTRAGASRPPGHDATGPPFQLSRTARVQLVRTPSSVGHPITQTQARDSGTHQPNHTWSRRRQRTIVHTPHPPLGTFKHSRICLAPSRSRVMPPPQRTLSASSQPAAAHIMILPSTPVPSIPRPQNVHPAAAIHLRQSASHNASASLAAPDLPPPRTRTRLNSAHGPRPRAHPTPPLSTFAQRDQPVRTTRTTRSVGCQIDGGGQARALQPTS
jgi:hypothetical protein